MRHVHVLIALLVLLAIASGCQQPQLVPTPNVYLDPGVEPFTDVPSVFRTNTVDMLYATDRMPKEPGKGAPQRHLPDDYIRYGYERSRSLVFGSCVVEIGKDVSWDALVEASRTEKRKVRLPLHVRSITETGRFPETPPPLEVVNGVRRVPPSYQDAKQNAVDAFHDELRRRLTQTPRKEALVFVHGFNNTFEEVAHRMTDLWHFLGREGVPIIYSWPAGHPGLLKGYTHDRESSEYTIFHLKEFIRTLAACPELESINFVSHSRGTDVLMTAVRELILVTRASGRDLRSSLKFGAIILAAPDISGEVFLQRNSSENLQGGCETLTFYVMKNDRAIGSAEWLFADKKRIGQIRPDQISERQRTRFEALQEVAVVDSRIKTDFLGHGYFLSSPATLSDLILDLRYDRKPGAANGRPLTEIAPSYYILDDNYPQKAAPMPTGMRPAEESE
ncbi:MAG: alpha/beta hydrolase [Planctomycetota bacterium]|jgi:esterase/lipase superfamily enzyme